MTCFRPGMVIGFVKSMIFPSEGDELFFRFSRPRVKEMFGLDIYIYIYIIGGLYYTSLLI